MVQLDDIFSKYVFTNEFRVWERVFIRFLSVRKSNGSSTLENPQKHKKENKNHMLFHLTETTNVNILKYFHSALRDKKESYHNWDHVKL